MEFETLIAYKGKLIKLKLKNGYKYQGILLFIKPTEILIDDIKDGNTWIISEQIASIAENGRDNK